MVSRFKPCPVISALLNLLAADSSQQMTQSPFANANPTANPAAPPDYTKIFKAEVDNLQLSEGVYKWVGEGVEERVLKMYGKL